jgi:cardiolipin synthase
VNLPNTISLARLLVAPVAVVLISERLDTAAFALFVLAGLSDAADGLIAKRFDRVTTLGGFLDPIADKALLLGTYLSLQARDLLPLWLVILVISRDILIVGGALLIHILTERFRPRPSLVSKVNTFMQIALAAAVLAGLALGLDLEQLVAILVWVVAGTTCASGAAYVVSWSSKVVDQDQRTS